MCKQLGFSFLVWLSLVPALLRGQDGMFTYQGRLLDGGQPANGAYDLQFALADSPFEEGYIGPTLTDAPVLISNGLFTVTLDFGFGVFDGSARWLEIGVRTNGSADAYTVLSPRQPITAAPYAIYAATAGASNSGAGTNVTVYGGLSLAGPTNVVLYATNNYVITTSANTNVIVVNGTGTYPANGVYTLQSTSPNLLFVNASGMRLIYLPDDPDFVWQIVSPQSAVLYGSSADDFSNANLWVAVAGAAPKPRSIAYGVNFVKNYITQLAIQGANPPGPLLGNELYVNAAIGSDVFALRGRPDLPYKTVYAALRAAATNDVVRVAPGVYNETFNLTLPPGLKLLGAGKRVTCLYGAQSGFANLDLSSSNILSGFSTDFIISLGGYAFTFPAYGGPTNTLLENVEAYGGGDVVFGTCWQGFRAVNCDFISRGDCFADGQLWDAGTNAVAELYNCRLVGGWHVIGHYGRGQIRMFGGSIEATSASSSTCVFAWDSGRAGASIELNGVSLRHPPADAGGQSYAIVNESSGHCAVTVKGMLLDPGDVYGSVNFTGFGPTTNLPVLGPGSVTNVLCFTNGILMKVK